MFTHTKHTHSQGPKFASEQFCKNYFLSWLFEIWTVCFQKSCINDGSFPRSSLKINFTYNSDELVRTGLISRDSGLSPEGKRGKG